MGHPLLEWLFHPTDVPCPAWCSQEAGHGYVLDVEAEGQGLSRVHRTTLSHAGLSVELFQVEQAASVAGPIHRAAPTAYVEACDFAGDVPADVGGLGEVDGLPLTARDLYAFAALLHHAGDALSQITQDQDHPDSQHGWSPGGST